MNVPFAGLDQPITVDMFAPEPSVQPMSEWHPKDQAGMPDSDDLFARPTRAEMWDALNTFFSRIALLAWRRELRSGDSPSLKDACWVSKLDYDLAVMVLKTWHITKPAPLGTRATIVCAVCRQRSDIAIDAPAKLCDLCSVDLDAAERQVKGFFRAAIHQLEAIGTRFDVFLAQHKPDDQQRYQTLAAKRTAAFAGKLTEDETRRVLAGVGVARSKGDGLSAILNAEAERDRAIETHTARQEANTLRYDAAMREIEIAREAQQ